MRSNGIKSNAPQARAPLARHAIIVSNFDTPLAQPSAERFPQNGYKSVLSLLDVTEPQCRWGRLNTVQ